MKINSSKIQLKTTQSVVIDINSMHFSTFSSMLKIIARVIHTHLLQDSDALRIQMPIQPGRRHYTTYTYLL